MVSRYRYLYYTLLLLLLLLLLLYYTLYILYLLYIIYNIIYILLYYIYSRKYTKFMITRTLRFCASHNWFCNFKLIGRSPSSCVKQTGVEGSLSPANTIHCPIVGSMLGQRRRRLTNIEPALGQCLVFAGRKGIVTRD